MKIIFFGAMIVAVITVGVFLSKKSLPVVHTEIPEAFKKFFAERPDLFDRLSRRKKNNGNAQ